MDLFNLVQLVVLLLALIQTMVLHRLEHAKHSDLVIVFDKVFRVFIPFCLYPRSSTAKVAVACGSPCSHSPLRKPVHLLRATLWAQEESPRRMDADERLWRRSAACS